MKKLVLLLFIFFAANPHVTLAQKNSTEHAKQRRAGQVADRFVNRFRATLDFGMAWKAFRLSDPSCTHRANGNLSESDYERFKLSSRTIEKLYIATMNLYYLMAVHDLSLARIDSQSDSDDSLTPNEVKIIRKRSKFLQNDEREPQNATEVGELISTFDQLSALYRKHMPAGAMKSPAWRANQKYLMTRSGTDHGGTLNGDETFCVPQKTKVYIVDRGLFYFYVVEEGHRMKVAGLGID
jgi:predicted MPP superfamily phosphohydrolase